MKTKKVKFNLLAIIGMMIAIGTLAFTKEKHNVEADLHWFNVSETGGTLGSYIGEFPSNANPLGCISNPNDYCALAYTNDDLTDPDMSPSGPEDLKPAIQNNPVSFAAQERFKP